MKRLVLGLVVAACGAGGNVQITDGGTTDSPTSGDASGCQALIAFNPATPVADPTATIRAQAQTFGELGINGYTWYVMHNNLDVPTAQAAQDGSQIDFVAPDPGPYYVRVVLHGASNCSEATATLGVLPVGGQYTDYRLRVVPPASAGAPPQEAVVQVIGGANISRDFALDPGQIITGAVKNGATGVPAYLRFMPAASPKVYIETFSAASGAYSTRLLGQNHTVLVVPMTAGLAPALLPWDLTTTTLAVSAGNAVTGTVKDGAGNPLPGAQVQLVSGGVPSTLATTAADGSFTVRTSFGPTATVDVAVTPPAGRGLPVLAATGTFGATIAIQYASATTCNIGATPVMRGATAEPNARVTVVATFPSAGTIGGATAGGTVRIAATADGTGHLPSTLVPQRALVAVVDLGGGDLATSLLNETTCSAVSIDAPARVTATGVTHDATGNPLAGARIEALPTGALALAGTPTVEAGTDGSGAFALSLASGGRYDITFSDPLGLSAPLVVAAATAADVPAIAALAKALKVSGKVSVYNNANPIVGASVQMLCLSCGAAVPPVAETATTDTSTYALGIPDPGM